MSEPLIIINDEGVPVSLAGCVCIKCGELNAYIERLLDERNRMNQSWNDRCLAAERKVLQLMENADAALQRRVAELETQVNRRCECGELVDCPENIHCGACA